MKKTLATTALGAVLTLTSLGSAFAAEVPAQSIEQGQRAVTAIKFKAATNLDEASKSKVKAIFDQMKAGSLTEEQTKAQLKELGVDLDFDVKGTRDVIKFKADKVNSINIDDATKEKAKAILEQAQAGSLTKEQVKAQLQELGINMDVDFGKGHHFQVKMDKSKMDNLDEATKEKVKSILDQMKAGTLTEEQVKAKLQELGINMEVKFGTAHSMTKGTNKVMKAVKIENAAQQKM